ncbi:hypothetical protein JWH04_20640 [Xanthomonas melonis]|uniref:gp58-like family protein n=1 Tax=Xanthomonas melonis TaxID=56456 RepID=UPI001E331917|nr:gp58-like family protein [Xanthomonas melonis]MCD0281318.1 hypothetical protein [Xanthomonas melonis]
MSRPVLLIEIGAGPLPAVTPVTRPSGSWVPVVYKAPVVETPTDVTPTPVTDGVLLQWSPIAAADVIYIIDRAPAAEGPWVEIARTAATRYLYSDGTNAVWFFRIRASINGRVGGGNVVRVQLDMTTEKIRQEFLQATQRDQDLAKQLQRQAQDLANLQALVDAPEWLDQAWPSGSIVKHDGGLYVAKQDVPVGIAITDATYWTSIGEYASLADAVGAIGVAMQQITTDVQQIERELQIVAQDVSGVRSSLTGKADASAVQAMNTRLTQAENDISSLSQLISTVQSKLSGKADSSALQALQTQVTQIGNEVTSQSTAIAQVRSSVGGTGNLLPGTEFADNATVAAWVLAGNDDNASAEVVRNLYGDPRHPFGMNTMVLHKFTPNGAVSGALLLASPIVPITPGDIMLFSAYLGAFRCQASVGIIFYKRDGGFIGPLTYSEAISVAIPENPTLAAYARPSYRRTAPGDALYARAVIRMSGTQSDPHIFVVRPMLSKVTSDQSLVPEWEPGGIGLDQKYASATQSLSTRVTRTENGVASYEASATLALDVNGRVAGVRSVNNGTTSTIDFVFDKVRFLSPSAGGARAELVNGNYFVWAPNGVRVVALGWSY